MLIVAVTVLAAACGGGGSGGSGPVPTPSASAASQPSVAASATPSATTASVGPASSPSAAAAIHVILAVATPDKVTIDVTDLSRSLVSATSGRPGDGATVEAYKLVVTQRSPTSVRLTWLGGPCDSANSLSIDEGRKRLLLVQPECPGDAIVTDRILDLVFSSPVTPAEFEPFLQDGLDT
jgi:hypothetical protein